MNILVVSQYFHPENFRVNDLVVGLQERGHAVTVLTGQPNYPSGKFFDGYKFNIRSDVYEGVKVFRVPLFPRGERSRLRLSLNYLSFVIFGCLVGPFLLRKQKFDNIFVYGISPIFAVLPAIMIKHVKKAPLSLWLQDLWPESLKATGMITNRGIIRAVGKIVSFIYSQVDLVFVTSKGFGENILRYGGPSIPVKFLPQWGEEIFEASVLAKRSEAVSQFEGMFSVVFAGNLGVAQSLETLVRAASLVKSQGAAVNFFIFGAGREQQNLERLVSEAGLRSTFRFMGNLPIDDMPSIFRAADLLYLGLKDEEAFNVTIPGKLQAYMASSTAVVCAANGASAELVIEANSGLVGPADDSAILAENILSLHALDQRALEELGQNGRAYYLQHFQRSAVLSTLEQSMAQLNESSC